MKPDVSALVVSWNSDHVLREMLVALQRAGSGLDVELVHIDNASTDRSVELVAKLWDGPLLQQRNAANVGFAPALKQAVAMARGEFLLLLNPDARIGQKALSALVQKIHGDPSIGAVGPLIRTPDGEVEFLCARRAPTLLGELIQELGLRPLTSGTYCDRYTYQRDSYLEERDVPCLSGAAMLVRAEALAAAGGIDDRLFMYFEDIDICERLRQVGYRVRFYPSAKVEHISRSSSPRDSSLEIWLSVQAEMATNLFFSVHRGRVWALVHRALVALGGTVRTAAYLINRKWPGRLSNVPPSGQARLRWALTGRMPAGGPATGPDYAVEGRGVETMA